MAHDARYPPQMSDSERREASVMLTLVFIVGLVGTLLLTLGGVHALVQLVDATNDFKSSIVASVLGLGLVVLGPALLLALATLLPRWWFKDMRHRLRKLFRTRVRSADS